MSTIPKILYIEDNEDNYRLVEMLLKAQGFKIAWGKTGLEGLGLVKSYKPDLILMDINLPDIKGSTITTKLKADKITSSIPVIAVSANTTEQSKEEALVAGCDGFIEKPINVKTFVSQLLAYLSGFRISLDKRNQTESLKKYNLNIINRLENKVRELTHIKNELEDAKKNLEKKVEARTKELKESYERLKEVKMQFIQSEKMSSLGQLVAGIAHEINNPISYVLNNLAVLAEDSILIKHIIDFFLCCKESNYANIEENCMQYINVINDISGKLNIYPDEMNEELEDLIDSSMNGLERVKTIVQELRDFSRLNKDNITPVSVNDALESALTFLHYTMRNDIVVKKDLCDNNTIEGNFQALVQVFMNILSNAVQAIKSDRGKGNIFIRTKRLNNSVVVEIANDGPMIAKEIQNKIFDPFFTTKPPGEGTGLGLSVSYSILRSHKAKIKLISPILKNNRGASFAILFPISYTKK